MRSTFIILLLLGYSFEQLNNFPEIDRSKKILAHPGNTHKKDLANFDWLWGSSSEDSTKVDSGEMHADPFKKYVCTNGIKPSTLSKKEYLNEFNKGPCNGAIITPGFIGYRQKVKIDCEKVIQNYPEIASTCNWNQLTCSTLDKIQTLFPPFPDSKLANRYGIASYWRCWVKLFKLKFQKNAEQKYENVQLDGLYIFSDFGGNPKFNEAGENIDSSGNVIENIREKSCGFKATNVLMEGTKGGIGEIYETQDLYEKFMDMGYYPGLTANIVPFDWRTVAEDALKQSQYPELIRSMYALTGKQVTLIAHSQGTLITYQGAMALPEKERIEKVARTVLIAPAFGGSNFADRIFWNLNPSIVYSQTAEDIFLTGMPYDDYHDMFVSFSVFASMKPKNIFANDKLENEDWVKKIKARKLYEDSGNSPDGTIPLSFMRGQNDLCTAEQRATLKTLPEKNQFAAQCTNGLELIEKYAQINDNLYKLNESWDAINKYSSMSQEDIDMQRQYDTELSLDNPKVPTNIVYTNHIATPHYLELKIPENETKHTHFVDPEKVHYIPGDGTISAESQMIAGLKWATEFDKGVEGAKPVHMIQACDHFNQRIEGIYKDDLTEAQRMQRIKQDKNLNYGVDCECNKPLSWWESSITADACSHGEVFQDDFVIKEIQRIMVGAKPGKGITDFASNLDDKTMDDIVDKCIIEKPQFLKNWKSNLIDKGYQELDLSQYDY